MNLAETNTCSFCNRCEEAISHLFYECQNITPIWERVSKLVNDLVQPMSVNKQNALLGSNETNVKLDRLLLEEKKYLYNCRNKDIKPSLLGLKNSLLFSQGIIRSSKIYENERRLTTIVEYIIQRLP